MEDSRISGEAVDIVADASGADQAFVIVSGCHSPYWKAVSFMAVGHSDRVLANPIQVSDIYALLDCTIGSHLGQ
jgi:hypothetical protein